MSVAIEQVGDVAGQRYFDVRLDGDVDQIAEDRLRWVWRLVLTTGVSPNLSAPATLVSAQKAIAVQVDADPTRRALRVACARCGRADSASLFRTVVHAADDVYFTRCRRCWRSRVLGSFRR